MKKNKIILVSLFISCLFIIMSIGCVANEEYNAAYFGLNENMYQNPSASLPIEERLWLPKASIRCNCETGFYIPVDAEEQLQNLLENAPQAIVVEIGKKAVQFETDNPYQPVVTLTQVEIVEVCKNAENDAMLVPKQSIWVQESYGIIDQNGIRMLYAAQGCEQNPLIPGHKYLIFPNLIENSNGVYTYNHFLVDMSSDFYNDIHYDETLLYSDTMNQYADRILSHFGLLEGQDGAEQTDQPTSAPNLAAIFVSTSVLLALGALTYTVNETAKKNRQSKDT